MQLRNLARVAQYVLMFIGVCALWYWSVVLLSATVYQVIQGREFSRALQAKRALNAKVLGVQSTASSKSQQLSDNAMIGSLIIPRLGLSTIVVEGVGDRDLKLAAGHIPGTSLPGRKGNVGIAGHRDTFFRPLRRIRRDDAIRLITLSGEFEYRVVSTEIVEPDDVRVLFPAKTETLTLVTCYPFTFVGPAPKRFIIQAVRIWVKLLSNDRTVSRR